MSSKGSQLNSVISLPTGGGALRGLGEKFSPDLQSGTGSFSIPVALPPGRNGFQPTLTLQYSTGIGNGPFGLGWGLSVPGVARKTSKGVPRYADTSDVFVLSGAEDLVPVEVTPDWTRYQPRTEGLFARILHHRGAGGDFWEVKSKDGLVSIYGTPRPAGAPPDWRDPAAIVNPERSDHILAWRLSRTSDPFRNRIDYTYERDATPTDGPHHWDQLYLTSVRYGDYGDRQNPQFLAEARFLFGPRPDGFSDYRGGFEVRTVQRCNEIQVLTNTPAATLARSYVLTYLDGDATRPGTERPINGSSLLSQVTVIGHDGDKTEQLPPLQFSYTRFDPQQRRFTPLTGADLPPVSLAHPDFELIDLFGHGLPDIVQLGSAARFWRNLGDGAFDRPREMRTAPAGLRLSDPGVQLIDANGDGRVDLLVTTPILSGYFPTRFDGTWDQKSFHRYERAPGFNLEDPEVKLVDLDGDGVTDAVRSGTTFECFFNDAERGWVESRRVERRALEVFPNVNFSDPRVKWGDFSGDGLQDIALVFDGSVQYWPNLGYGNWGRRVPMRRSPRLPEGYNPKRILVGDVDGDGLADIVYVDNGKVTLWINQSGNAWSDPIVVTGTPPVSDMDSVRLIDVLGTGVAGVLFSTVADGPGRSTLYFLDFTGGLKPNLLNTMDNQIGAVTRVEYAPSTRFFIDDQKLPATRWKTPLPFPVQVVARVEALDELSKGKLTTEYRYHHGYWDGAEREFRGFGRVDRFDSETFDIYHRPGLHGDAAFAAVTNRAQFSPPTLTKTWFHIGPVGDEFNEWTELDLTPEYWSSDRPLLGVFNPVFEFLKSLADRRARRDAIRTLRGTQLRSELYAVDGSPIADRPYTVTEAIHGLRQESPPTSGYGARPGIVFPHALAARTTQWERGDEPLTQFTFSEDYDPFGQPHRETQLACPRGWRSHADVPGVPYLGTQTRTVRTEPIDPDNYLHTRVYRSTVYEIANTGQVTLVDLKQRADARSALVCIGQTYNYYDGPAFDGLPGGQVGAYGAVTRSESLVLTEEILASAYAAGDGAASPGEVPPYLVASGSPSWSADYPAEFRSLAVSPLLGYRFHLGGPDAEDVRGYFAPTSQRRYDFQVDTGNGLGRGLTLTQRDALGPETTITDFVFEQLPTRVVDPVGLVSQAAYNPRTLQVQSATDPNDNQVLFSFSPLGLLTDSFVRGKAGEGDQTLPSVHRTYGFSAFIDSKRLDPQSPRPIFVHSTRRVHHDTETDVALPERDTTIESREYSDGFGRLLQTRAQAEDTLFGDPRFGGNVLPADQGDGRGTVQPVLGRTRAASDPSNVAVSGWQVFDNKGRVVEKYEPFYSIGYEYGQPTDAELGQKAALFYDPRGHVVRTLNPDGSEQRVLFGVPGTIATPNLETPDTFEPTPWEAYTYDPNDNAGRTHPRESFAYRHHWNTPGSIVIDALGRTVLAVARNRAAPDATGALPAIEELRTASQLDIRGNLIALTDALGRIAFRYTYDLANRRWRTDSIDAGTGRAVPDALGGTVEQRDSKGALLLQSYDRAHRPIRLWARDSATEAVTLRQYLAYGDAADSGLTFDGARAGNLVGKLYRHYDEAGRATFEAFDFKGNLTEKVRQVIADDALAAVFVAPPPDWQVSVFRVDWTPASGGDLETRAAQLLDPTEYRSSSAFDALGRVNEMRYPEDVSGGRKRLAPVYNRAGALERVSLDDQPYVGRIAYNAKGQRVLIAYGNGVITCYAHDPQTFRLVRLRSEIATTSTPASYLPGGTALQDFSYEYDLVGNITQFHDRTPASGVPNTPRGPDALDRAFGYDAIYRLLSATGREGDRPPDNPWDDSFRTNDPTKTRLYAEAYSYDAAGNLLSLSHRADSGTFTRDLTLVPGTTRPANNRLSSVRVGPDTVYTYDYDASGNLTGEDTSRHFEWDHSNHLRAYRTQAGTSEPSVFAQYLYDATGERVKKYVRRQGGQIDTTTYIDGAFEVQTTVAAGGNRLSNNTLHVTDGQSRVALVRVGTAFPDDATPPVKYQLGDHLGSSNAVFGGDDAGSRTFVNREEYTPYGETSFGGFGRKRYRFTGQERDEESGLNYHEARYYAAWLARWTASDPAGPVDGSNLYAYARCNPVARSDPGGMDSGEAAPVPAVTTTVEPDVNLIHDIATDVRTINDLTEHAPNTSRISGNMRKAFVTMFREILAGHLDQYESLFGGDVASDVASDVDPGGEPDVKPDLDVEPGGEPDVKPDIKPDPEPFFSTKVALGAFFDSPSMVGSGGDRHQSTAVTVTQEAAAAASLPKTGRLRLKPLDQFTLGAQATKNLDTTDASVTSIAGVSPASLNYFDKPDSKEARVQLAVPVQVQGGYAGQVRVVVSAGVNLEVSLVPHLSIGLSFAQQWSTTVHHGEPSHKLLTPNPSQWNPFVKYSF